jgi:hypothetical protein
MRLVILYRPESEHGRVIEDFIREYQFRNNSKQLEVVNVDTRDGIATATLYDIMQYPAILVLQNDGQVHKMWQGNELPLIDEVASYTRA